MIVSEFEEKLNAILSSPETMAQVASIAQSLGMSAPQQPQEPERQQPPPAPPPQSAPQAAPPPAGDPSSLLGQIDPKMISRLLPLLGELNSPQNSQRAQLLYALRPFLKEERRDKIDKALQVAHIIHLGKKFLGTLGES